MCVCVRVSPAFTEKSSAAKIPFKTIRVFNDGRQVAPTSCIVISREIGILIKCVDLQVAVCRGGAGEFSVIDPFEASPARWRIS